MKTRFAHSCYVSLVICVLQGCLSAQAFAQAQEQSAIALLLQLSSAFSGSQAVQHIQLSGNAAWYEGSLQDSGSVSLIASSDGTSLVQFQLSSLGARNESQSGRGPSAVCQWAGDNGLQNELPLASCTRPTAWFLPGFSIESAALAGTYLFKDLGIGAVGVSGGSYRHLQYQLNYTTLPPLVADDLMDTSTGDLGLDQTTLLPAVLAYLVRPDNGSHALVEVEIHYSNYQTISGVRIPFLIQRYVNRSLELEIHVNSATMN